MGNDQSKPNPGRVEVPGPTNEPLVKPLPPVPATVGDTNASTLKSNIDNSGNVTEVLPNASASCHSDIELDIDPTKFVPGSIGVLMDRGKIDSLRILFKKLNDVAPLDSESAAFAKNGIDK
ncbi:UNVERIFIED_CONTAM: hypothetical protein HDU68_005482, partial [Siphonaria sp. JEL0065]